MTVGPKTPATCTVRRVERGDVDALVALCAEHARYERADYDPSDKAVSLERVLFDRPARLTAWMAEAQGNAVGYATATGRRSGTCLPLPAAPPAVRLQAQEDDA